MTKTNLINFTGAPAFQLISSIFGRTVSTPLAIATAALLAHGVASAQIPSKREPLIQNGRLEAVSNRPDVIAPGLSGQNTQRQKDQRLAKKRLGEQAEPESLKKLLENIHSLIYVRKDKKSALALLATLYPDEERARKALKDDLAPETLQKILEFHKELRSMLGVTNITDLAEAKQTVVKVHGATTEEIASYAPGSLVYTEFPGGTRKMAEQVLRPGMTFYEVEFLEPGKGAGVKYHLFYWDGKRWTMLGPLWRTLR